MSEITIISGGQTGADRAALDFALNAGLPHGGWCPRGRVAEDGPLPPRYQLEETPSRKYAQRTEWNVRDSDATVLFTNTAQVTGGTRLAQQIAIRLGKPTLHLAAATGKLSEETIDTAAATLARFLAEHDVERLNVAGPRASQEPSIGDFVRQVLQRTFRA